MQGYFVGRVEKNLYWVTDTAYQSAFLSKHVVRIGQVQARQLLASENDPARPVPDVTLETSHT